MEYGTGIRQSEARGNVVPFKRLPVRDVSDDTYLEMKELMFLMCEVLAALLPREQIEELRLNGPENARCRTRVKNWLKRSFFFRDSGLYKAFKASGVDNSDTMANNVMYELHLWLMDNF